MFSLKKRRKKKRRRDMGHGSYLMQLLSAV